MEKKRYLAIDGLRTIAAFCIVIMHVIANMQIKFNNYSDKIISSFAEFVYLFMIISAFGMCCGYYEKITNQKISVSDFYFKRYKKILPFFAVLVVLDLIISPSLNSLYEAFADLTLVFGLLPQCGNISVIGVGWFLGVIFVFYLVFPFFCYLLQSKKRIWFALIISLLYNFIGSIYFKIDRTNILFCSCFFIAGGIIYLYKEQLEKIAQKFKWLFWILIIIAIVGYYYFNRNVYANLILCCILLIYAIGVNKKGVLQNRFTKFISGISMEIYLSHMLIFRVIEKLRIERFIGNVNIRMVLVIILTLIGSICFSLILKKMIVIFENKLIQIRLGKGDLKV